MPPTLTVRQARHLRMAAQGLSRREPDTVAAVRRCVGVQAQDLAASRLAVRARVQHATRADVVAACDDGRVVRSWFQRGTLHMVAAADASWLTALLGPITVAKYRTRRASLGLTDPICAHALRVLPDLLGAGPRVRADLVRALNAVGVPIATTGQAPAHLVLYAAASGVIRRGPDHGTEPTYVLAEPGPPHPEPAAELARRYIEAFAPAGVDDFTAWSGLPAPVARAAFGRIRPTLVEVTVDGRHLWLPEPLLADAAPTGTWRLLPAFDTFLLGYRHRDLLIDPASVKRVYAGGGWIHPAVVHDGHVVGDWRARPDGPEITLFDGAGIPSELHTDAADVERFLS